MGNDEFVKITRRSLMVAGLCGIGHPLLKADVLTVGISSNGTIVTATIISDDVVGVENGVELASTSAQPTNGVVSLTLGRARSGVYPVRFVRGPDSYAGILAIADDGSLTTIDATGKISSPSQASNDLLSRFWQGFTKQRFDAIISGAIEEWIGANATGGPVLIVIGLVSGPFSAAFLLGALAKAADLVALII